MPCTTGQNIRFEFEKSTILKLDLRLKVKLSGICKHNDVIICDSWKSLNAVPTSINKIYVFAHGQEFLAKEKKFEKIKKSLNRASCIICSSHYTANLIDKLKITDTKKIVIPPTYSLEKLSKKKKKSTKNSIVSLLTICRLEKRKGILPVLRCLSNLNRNKLLKPFRWNICGEGLDHKEIKENIRKLNLSDKVFLIGMLLFLVASGLTLIFGVLNVINFAHGTFYMVGAYFAFSTYLFTESYLFSAFVGALGAGIFGIFFERVLISKVYGQDILMQLLVCYAFILITDDLRKASLVASDIKEKDPKSFVQVCHWNETDVEHYFNYIDSTKVELNETFIDFNFHTHLRHHGNKEHAKNYLKWETNLIKKMDEEERDFFR